MTVKQLKLTGRALTFAFAFFSIVLIHTPSLAAADATAQRAAAESGLAGLRGADAAIGLASSLANMESASTIGQGFQIFTISPQQLASADSTSIPGILTASSLWQFIVMGETQPQALLTVDRVGDQWLAVSLGAAGLAAELVSVIQAWPESSGYSLTFVRVYQAKSDLIVVSKAGTVIGVVPLISARIALGIGGEQLDPLSLSDEKVVLSKLKEVVARALQ